MREQKSPSPADALPVHYALVITSRYPSTLGFTGRLSTIGSIPSLSLAGAYTDTYRMTAPYCTLTPQPAR